MRIVLAAFLLSSFSIYGQTVDTILTKYQDMEVASMSFRDSLFLKISYPSAFKYQYFWCTKGGTHEEVKLKELDRETIFAITKNPSAITYYYLSKDSKKIEVSSLEVQNDGLKVFSKNPIEIDGKFLGSYTDRTLHIYTFNKKEKFLLTDTEIDGGSVIGETSFQLSINLSNYKGYQIAFIPEGSYPSPQQLKAAVKIYNRKKELIIVADDPWEQFKNEQNSFFTTTVLRINKQSKKAVTNTLFEQRQGNFRSEVWGNYLIKLIYDDHNGVGGIELEMIQLDNMKRKIIQHIPFKRVNKIARLGNSNRTIDLFPEGKKKRKVDVGTNASPFVLIDSINNKLILTLGSNFDVTSPIMAATPFGMVGFFLSAALHEVSWGDSNQLYTYLAGDFKSDFVEIDQKQFAQGVIDRYEIAKDEEQKRFNYKGYALFNEKVYCIYKFATSKFLIIASFDKLLSQ